MNAVFENISMLHWLWLLPILPAVLIFTFYRAKKRSIQFYGQRQIEQIDKLRWGGRNIFSALCLVWALALIIVALARPAWNPVEQEITREGREVVFLLDVSNSMLADDLRPNRLERAKADIMDTVEALDGDMVALVVFAGNATVQCPLTRDYGFFRMMLNDVSTESVMLGGTNIGDAIRLVADHVLMTESQARFKDVILITDGEDHDSLPVEAAEKLGKAGVRLIAIGIGDDREGTPVMITEKVQDTKTGRIATRSVPLKYKGEIVRSKLDSETLKKMVANTKDGIYIPAGTGNLDLLDVYKKLISSGEKTSMESQIVLQYEQKFQIFILAAMIFLALAIGLRRR